MLYDIIYNYRKKIVFISTTIVLLMAAIFIGIYFSRYGKSEVEIATIPSDATIAIETIGSLSPGTHYITPGSYQAKITRDGFEPLSRELVVEESNNLPILISLDPNSPKGEEWMAENQSKVLEFEGLAGTKANIEGDELRRQNPLINNLPHRNLLYSIGYKNDPSNDMSVIITIDAPDIYKEAALQQIENWGYDPTRYNIEFTNYENPFES